MTVKSLSNLVDDMALVLAEGVDPSPQVDQAFDRFKSALEDILRRRLVKGEEDKRDPIRLSAIGGECQRKMWYRIHQPELEEELSPSTKFKFMYGDVIEALVLLLADLAGHEVRNEQDEVIFHGVPGHVDAVVDGVVCDVKSASSLAYKKFKEGLSSDNDVFGYLYQLGAYVGCADKLRADKRKGAFIAVDKQHGHIVVDEHEYSERDLQAIRNRIDELEKLRGKSVNDVPRLDPEPDGKSGNMKLCTTCSYCGFKRHCWPELRTFIYSTGPRHLVKVVREPNVPEVVR